MPLVIRRRDPARRMARFYQLSLQRVLTLGAQPEAVHLVREWGRIGSPGTVRCDAHASLEAADQAALTLAARKRRKGYR